MVCPSSVCMGGDHSGTLQRLISNTRTTREDSGVIRYPPKLGSSLVMSTKSTLKSVFRRKERDISFYVLYQLTVKWCPELQTHGFFDSVRIG
jgi:hypothetical protein